MAKRAVVWNAVTYGTLLAAGDVSQRMLVWRVKKAKGIQSEFDWNWRSAGNCLVAGTGIFGPGFFYWYKFLDWRLKGTAARTIVTKTALDMGLFSPFSLSAFLLLFAWLDGSPQPLEDYKRRFPKTYLVALSFWAPAQLVNFKFVPPKLRVVYVAVTAFMWANILCYMKNI